MKKSVYPNIYGTLSDVLLNESDFRVTKIAVNSATINIDTAHTENHNLIKLAKDSRSYKICKSRHENIQKYLLENDNCTVSTEVPVWVEPGEFKDYFEVFKNKEPLTGHIDIIRLELDGKIGVWDYKPKAYD